MCEVTKKIFYVFASVLFLLLGVASFNLAVDPMCYRCDQIDLQRATQNVYYRSAQTVVANPDANVLVLGSSRGELVPPSWIENKTGLKTINLSQGGAEVLLKSALLNIALEKNPNIKTVIWMADYFELTDKAIDIKTRLTPVLQKYSGATAHGLDRGGVIEKIQGLIDHRTLEAGLEMLGKNYSETYDKEGAGREINYRQCENADFAGSTPANMIEKKIAESYAIFGDGWKEEQNPILWKIFENQIQKLSTRGIKVVINISPYHPELFKRVLSVNPHAAKLQQQWSEKIESLAGPNVQVLHYENGIPGDDGSPRFWLDGAHPTCLSEMTMLESALKKWN